MTNSGFHSIGVLGAGQMGAGIAQICACNGFNVVLFDLNEDTLNSAVKNIGKSVEKLKSKGLLTTEQAQNIQSLSTTLDLAALSSCDLIIEAITENESIKCEVFAKLDKITKKETIFASNTSSIPITRLAGATTRPDRFIGMHFMNPVPLMELVEIIHGLQTSATVIERIIQLASDLGKKVTRSKDYPGFVVNRILMPMINEAFCGLMEGVASAEDIDTAMKLGTNQPMGPLALADFIGLDTCLAIIKVMHNGFSDPKYRPSPLLQQYVDAGWLGKKTGRGVYQYGTSV